MRSQSQLRNDKIIMIITTAFTDNKKQPRTADLPTGSNEFQPFDLECKYAICSGIV